MAITTRQNRTLAAEDWKRVYQSFQNADFQSYDFETLRKTMIDYLRTYYPENFNDYIESSEYIALIDLIAWLGQNLAFRTDLNARENFIDTAERRDSVIKLAKLINYNPKRTISGNGLLKVTSLSTTESVIDADGINLSNIPISWNDANNENWQDQFRTILNAALINSQSIGKPGNSQTILGVRNEEYAINLPVGVRGIFPFQATVNDLNMIFEAVSATSINKDYLYERSPLASQTFNVIYRNDNLGNASNNTGFFLMFKQGELTNIDFSIDEPLPNRLVNIDTQNINQDDHWLYELNSNNIESQFWTEVPAISGVNVIYNNSSSGSTKNIYQINSRTNDQVDLVFGDGSFSNIPKGNFRFYYRVNNGLSYKINSRELQNIILSINYISRTNRVETLTVRCSLQYTVNNASSRETLAEIKQRAPQQYYTLGRMISGEDYNIYPYTAYSNIIKVKAVNRTSSGISRFLDMIDSSGKYSRINVFAQDGVLYKSSGIQTQTFSFTYSTELDAILRNNIIPQLSEPEILHFYYANYPIETITNLYWSSVSTGANLNTGYFVNGSNVVQNLSGTKIRAGSTLHIVAPVGKYFNAQNQLVNGVPRNEQEKTSIYVNVETVNNNGLGLGTGTIASGLGSVSVNNILPTGAVIVGAIPSFSNGLSTAVINDIKNQLVLSNTFGLVYNYSTGNWSVDTSIDPDADFVYNNSSSGWLVAFKYTSGVYQVKFRSTQYIFESVRETNFYFDTQARVYDSKTATTIKDEINVLRINRNPVNNLTYESDLKWNIYDSVTEIDGYQSPRKVLVTYADLDNDSIPDNPYLFEQIVASSLVSGIKDRVYFELTEGYDIFVDRQVVDNATVVSDFPTLTEIENNKNLYPTQQIFFATLEKKFYQIIEVNGIKTVVEKTSSYEYASGRQNLYFQYQHNASDYRRIDPSTTNIVDLYVLTKIYNRDYIAWLRDSSGVTAEPEIPTTDELTQDFSGLDDVKSVSDTIILNPAKFKPLFGAKAAENLRAVFKVVKNPNVSIGDNEIKTSVISAINSYFDVENWDFGESFYFSELSAYLHQSLTPAIASIIIVPTSATSEFGDLLQVNAQPNEIITSAATVDNVEIISAITASQIGRLL